MGYNKEEILEKALKAIEDEECTTIDEVCLYLPISRATFYNYGLDKVDDIKEALEKVKVRLKKGMKRNWHKSDNPTLQIAAFKLMASESEQDALSTSKVKQENTHNFQNKPTIILDFGKEDKRD
jgi:hypothetical protein